MPAPTASPPHLSQAYLAWNDALCTRFLDVKPPEEPAYLALDDDILGELVHGGHVPSRPLDEAVRAELTHGLTSGLFSRFLRARRSWRAAGTPGNPPYVGLLGLCVLAASRMATDEDEQVWSTNFYAQLNRLLGLPRRYQPAGFDRVRELWLDLHAWLEDDEEGARGRSTVPLHPRRAHVDLPISQCLLRESDRRRLTDFFRAAGLEPGLEIGADELWALLRAWAGDGYGLSRAGLRVVAAATEATARDLGEIARRELQAWDGGLRDEQGRRKAPISLGLLVPRSGRITALLWPQKPEGFPVGAAGLPDGGHAELRELVSGWYEALALPVSRQVLERGLRLSLGDLTLAFEPSDLFVLRADLDLGCWRSVRQAVPLEEHVVACHLRVADRVREYLRRHASPGYRELGGGELPPAWRVFEKVKLVQAGEPADPALRPLAPRFGTAPRLEGGLQVADGLYLTGGEPDLWVTIGDGASGLVEIDDRGERLAPGIVKLELSAAGLPAGAHQVRAGGVTRRFQTADGLGLAFRASAPRLGHVLLRHGQTQAEAPLAKELPPEPRHGTIQVLGGCVRGLGVAGTDGDAPPVVLPTGYQRYVLLGAAGEVAEPAQPPPPAWLAELGDLASRWQFFEWQGSFVPEWALLFGRLGPRVLCLQDPPAPPTSPGMGVGDGARWSREILGALSAQLAVPAEVADRWAEYAGAAVQGTAA